MSKKKPIDANQASAAVVRLFKDRADDAAAAPDVLGAAEPLMPEVVRSGIARAWKQSPQKYPDAGAFWAANGARVLHERLNGRGSWRAQGRQWLGDLVDHVTNTVGVRADAPLRKALDEIVNPSTPAKRSKT